ncbi:MAG: hypothetical protein HY906_13665 [Deltaproteobacteria bacterium]|nr:hypothetical protein [Deltaproteobacteria bacterium]
MSNPPSPPAIRSPVAPTLLWLVVVAVAVAIPVLTVFRRSLAWICLNAGAFAALGGYVAWSYLGPFGLRRRARGA